ncbi:MAG TPA: hypothetical protein VFD86_03620 [Nitrospira sp.]|jgi:hypothetical protein|nr:hypothetical protein [Nitrospira sp.]
MASKSDEGSSLKRFAECAVGMRNIFYQDGILSEPEFLFMDNHFKVLEMAYLRWKDKHMPYLSGIERGTLQSKST